jgi:transposase
VKKRDNIKPDDNIRMFVGLDVHKKYSQVAIIDENGVVEKQERIKNEPRLIEEFSDKLKDAALVMESCSSWYWLYEILSRKHKIVLSSPAKTKAIASAKLKTDKVDALMLAFNNEILHPLAGWKRFRHPLYNKDALHLKPL